MEMKLFLFLLYLLNGIFSNNYKNSNHNKYKYRIRNKKNSFNSAYGYKFKLKSLFSISSVNVHKMNSEQRFQGLKQVTLDSHKEIKLQSGPIHYQNWGRYFTLAKGDGNKMKQFNTNIQYFNEQDDQFKKTHNYTNINIPSKEYFYFVLTDYFLNVISSRHNDITQVVEKIMINNLNEINSDGKSSKGGVEDLGNFQEGFCFILTGKEKAYFKWVICTDTYEEKCEFMKKIMLLRLRCQLSKTLTTNLKLTNECSEPTWVNLQDWSSCTLACGGGTQTLHRFCLRPPNAPSCDGDSILTRSCNTQPCPHEEPVKVDVLPTQIKIVQISLRPQKFNKCEIKEEDLDIIREDMGDLKIPPRIPSRVKLNRQYLTIFDPGMDEKIYKSFKLKEILQFKIWEEDNKCVKVSDCKQSAVMCIMCNSNSTTNKWIDDFYDFKDNCEKDEFRPKINNDDPRIKDIKKQLEKEELIKHAEEIRNKQKKKNEIKNIITLKKAQLIAMKILDKEQKYESRLEKEELMREEQEDKELKEEYICEENKKNNILKSILAKNEEEGKKDIELKEKLNDIQEDVKQKLIDKRKKIFRKIFLLKLAHERKKNKYRQQIMDIKRTLTQNMLKADKLGDEKKCINALETKGIDVYCKSSFVTDPLSLTDCLKQENFCYICCENEFGDMHQIERESCVLSCEKKEMDKTVRSCEIMNEKNSSNSSGDNVS